MPGRAANAAASAGWPTHRITSGSASINLSADNNTPSAASPATFCPPANSSRSPMYVRRPTVFKGPYISI